MDNQEAIKTLKTLCHTCKLFPKCAYKKPECFKAINMAIQALTREDETRQMLEAENSKAYCRYVEYRDGRISAFYDALGVNYAD